MPADSSKFIEGLKNASRAQLEAARLAVEQFGAVSVVGVAQNLCPVKTGALQASGTWTDAELKGEGVSMEVGFNTHYAAAVHEKLEAQHSVGQAKYLEAAMQEASRQFGPFVAKKVKEAAGE